MRGMLCGKQPLQLAHSRSLQNSVRASAPQRVFRAAAPANLSPAASASAEAAAVGTHEGFMNWMEANGMGEAHVTLKSVERNGHVVDTVVSTTALAPGDVALSIPEQVVVTLDRVFEDPELGELLTDNKLSELAVLTLYMMYEKKQGKASFWYEYIKELDRQRGRGQMGAKSPLLWDEGEVEMYLEGSPVIEQIQQRIKGIEREYESLDTVWFMSSSLFKNYPYDVPTEAFPLQIFQQAFAAVQACVVHLQGVPMSKRFALVPLGPPMLAYSSTSKAMLTYCPENKHVQLKCDRAIAPGEAVNAWCGPQPNSRLMLNYGIVDDDNPYDKLQLTVTLPSTGPLFRAKRTVLADAGLSTMQTFDLQRSQALPPLLLQYMRVALSSSELSWADAASPVSPETEALAVNHLVAYLDGRLGRYPTTIEQDTAIIMSVEATPRQKVASRLVRIEKTILQAARFELVKHATSQGFTIDPSPPPIDIKLI